MANNSNQVEYCGMMFGRYELPILRDMFFIQKGGTFRKKNGQMAGLGLFEHYKRFGRQLWPDEIEHRWTDLITKEYLQNILTSIMGCKDSGKTHTMSKLALMDYYCFPHETLCLISSTDVRGLELRIWGDLKSLHTRAQDRFSFIPGKLVDSKHAICTDNLDEDDTRDMRKGIICIPCLSSNGQFVGLGKYVGIKQKRRRLFGDEFSLMKAGILDSLANLNSGDFKGMFVGNPLGDGDPLDKLAEPKGGWSSIGEPDKTTVWDTRDIGGRCINLVGTDSPNFDQSQDPKPKFPFLIHQTAIDRVVARYGLNSFQYYSQCKGVRITGMDAFKVITRDLCMQFHAMEGVHWMNETRVKIYAVDAAYGNIGGDRCVGGWIEFGRDVTNKMVLRVDMPTVIPVRPTKMAGQIPEDQIAAYVRDACMREQIPPGHVFYDATGRGSLGTSFARLWSPDVNPVEFGGAATDRPVTNELMIRDHKTGQMRLMKGNERFSKFVSELWWTVRYVIESGQMRDLPEDVMNEGARRLWRPVRGDKIEIETKAEMKERTGESPDLFDWLVTAVEGARRLGFQIAKMTLPDHTPASSKRLEELKKKHDERIRSRQLTY